MKKIARKIKLWFIERWVGGTAFDLFLIGAVGMVVGTVIGLFVYYV